MSLDRKIYKELEDIVGKGNVSQDIGICETYRAIAAQTSAHYGPYEHWTPRPQAVVLPGSTEEVQRVVQLCYRHGIKFKAASTFYAVMGYIGSDYAIQIDMRRMNAVEIDAENRIAVIEPYAIGAAVQAEAMKYGLNLHIPGSGSSCSPLANAIGWFGTGPTAIFMGSSGENLLSAEWVTPEGEIIRTGTAGTGDGWFCGEGPGPGFRAVIRGNCGTAGSLGICTRIGLRLHPWPGPKVLPVTGKYPAMTTDLGKNFKCYTLCFNDWESWADAANLLYENDILYLGHRQFNMFGRTLKTAMLKIFTDPDKQFCDIPELLKDPETCKQNENMKIDLQVVIAGMTDRDMEYKEKALDEILRLTGGWKNEFMMEKNMHDWALLYLIRLGHKNLNYTYCGAYEGNFGLSPNVDRAAQVIEEASSLKDEWEKKSDGFAQIGGDSAMGSLSGMGGGGTAGWEVFVYFDAYDKESIRKTREFIDRTQEWMTEKGLGMDFGRQNVNARRPDAYDYTQDEQDAFFENMPQPLVMEYQWKIREAFDGKHLGSTYYRTLTPRELRSVSED